jgi:hypothetical protein
MLAFDFPPDAPIAVEYIGLSRSASAAENQKDILRRALAELVSGAGEIFEADAVRKQNSAAEMYIKCLQCELKDEVGDFTLGVEEEDRFRRLGNLQRSQFKIQIKRSAVTAAKTAADLVWKVEIGTRKPAWFPALKTDLLPSDGRLTLANFATQSCIEGVTCPVTKLYRSAAECGEQIKLWVNRRIDSVSPSLNQPNSVFVLPEKIPFISDVRSSSAVRITVVSKDSSLSIRTNGRALKSGSIGEYIPVEIFSPANFGSKGKSVNAMIVGEGEVQLVR